MWLSLALLLAGLAILIGGGEVFIKGSSSLARKLRVSPLVIGLTVVAFGTSVAELVVNIISALQGAPDLAVGNIIGSNIANVFLVLGIAAIIRPLTVKKGTVWKEIPFGILAVIMLFILGNDIMFGNSGQNVLTRGDGLVLIGLFVIFIYYTYGLTKVEGSKEKDDDVSTYSWGKSIGFVLLGLLGILIGGKLIVDNAVELGRLAGISELLIGATIVAVGTSLPEVVVTAIAAFRGHDDLAIGNIVGSNIFNVLWVLGLTPVIAPITMNIRANTDIMIAIISAATLFAFMFIGHKNHRYRLQRWQGLVFLLCYMAYTIFVVARG